MAHGMLLLDRSTRPSRLAKRRWPPGNCGCRCHWYRFYRPSRNSEVEDPEHNVELEEMC
jgi:hypothetical protein